MTTTPTASPLEPILPADASGASVHIAKAWHAARGARLLPARADLRARALGPILDLVIMLEYRSPDLVVVTATGQTLRDVAGYDMVGLNLMATVHDAARIQRARRFQLSAERPCGMFARQIRDFASGRATGIETLYLPLATAPGETTRPFIGIMTTTDSVDAFRQDRLNEIEPWGTIAPDFLYVDIGAGQPPAEEAPRPRP